nr:PH domain-containing protein [Cellulosimicrobium arenosum]
MEWRNEWFVATDKRLLLLYGLITHKVAMMPLKKVTDMNYGRSPTGRVLGYGQFLLESAGQDQALRKIDWVAQPDETYRRLCDTLFGPSGPDLDDDSPVPAPAPGARPGRTPTARRRADPEVQQDAGPAEAHEVEPVEPWDGRSPVESAPLPEPSPRADRPVVVVPGRETTDRHEPASSSTQPIPVHASRARASRPADEDTDDERGWTVSGEHRATYVPVVHPQGPPLPKPYEPGPGRDEAP